MKKAAVDQVMRRLTKEVSSFTIVVVDPQQDIADLKNTNPLVRLQNLVKTSVVLNQTEGIFPDFNRKEFDKIAIAIYEAARDATIYNDKATMLNVLSYPLHELLTLTMHQKVKMPFRFYDRILGAKIAHGTCS